MLQKRICKKCKNPFLVGGPWPISLCEACQPHVKYTSKDKEKVAN